MQTSMIRRVRTGQCCLSRRSISQSLPDRWVVYGGVEDGGRQVGYGGVEDGGGGGGGICKVFSRFAVCHPVL